MARADTYGSLVNEAGEIALSPDGLREAAFFEAALKGRRLVLDVGCGPGFPLVLVAPSIGAAVGLDISPGMLARAAENATIFGLGNVSLIRGVGEALPFLDRTFDGLAACGSLGSIADPSCVLSEMARVAVPGAVTVSIEQDFRYRLSEGAPRVRRCLRRDLRPLVLQVVHYLTDPYRIRTERYELDASTGFGQQLLADSSLREQERVATDLSPADMPAEVILDSYYEEERQFDPHTLRTSFQEAGFEAVEQRVAGSYGVPHIFARLGGEFDPSVACKVTHQEEPGRAP